MTRPARALFLLAAISAPLTAGSCGIAIKRDLSTIPQGQVGFDDMCGLQDYFDSLEAHVVKEPVVVSSIDLEGGDGKKTVRGGKARLVFQGNFLLKHGRRVLMENWRGLPDDFDKADKFEIEVRWAERVGVRRVVTDQPAELIVGNDSYALPYHVCLSELLYGAPLYKQRRQLWGLPDPNMTTSPIPIRTVVAPVDAGAAADGGTGPDGGPAAVTPQTATK